MGAPDILARLEAAGIRLSPLPDGKLWAVPRSALTDEIRNLILEHKPKLLAALMAAESRRTRVLAMLAENPSARYAVVNHDPGAPEDVILTLAIRGRSTCELRIPRDRYDPFLLLDLIERHGGTVN